jgi:hypothetical protein
MNDAQERPTARYNDKNFQILQLNSKSKHEFIHQTYFVTHPENTLLTTLEDIAVTKKNMT